MRLSNHSLFDVAKNNALEIEYVEGMPTKYDGHLDLNDEPRFIAVNRHLAEYDQIYVIAREVARLAQMRQFSSPLFDDQKKWELLQRQKQWTQQRKALGIGNGP